MNEAVRKDNIVQFPAPVVVEAVQGEVVKADVDKGFTQIANEFMDALCKLKLTGRQYPVFMTIIRKTYGYRKKSDWLTSTQIAELMDYESDPSNLRKDIAALKKRKLIVVDGRKIAPNPYVSEWDLKGCVKNNTCQDQPASVSKSTRKRVKNNPLTVSESTHTKDKKDNTTKDNNKKTKREVFNAPGWMNLELFEKWVEMRKLKKKPLTPYAKTLAAGKLKKLIDEGHDQNELVNHAIFKTWESFYPVPGQITNRPNVPSIPVHSSNTSAREGFDCD